MEREKKAPCAHYDPFGQDTVIDCLSCSNCDYRIINQNGTIIKDFDTTNRQSTEKSTKYVIEFFDSIPSSENIVKYLENNDSNYRITRDSDGVVLRSSIEDKEKFQEETKKREEEIQKRLNELLGLEMKKAESEPETQRKEKTKGFMKRIKEKMKR